MSLNLILFGVKETTRILAEYLHAQGICIELLVSVDKTVVEKNNIADYADLSATAKKIDAEYHLVQDYGLHGREGDFFQQRSCALGIAYGWQRLIPIEVLRSFQHGIYGFHASPEALPKGRGRSPLNWGLILGKKRMYNYCFKYAASADAGDIFSKTPFSITPHDTILTLLYKSLWIAKREILQLVHAIETNTLTLTAQHGIGYSFPKRCVADGLIQFSKQSTEEIVNLIRGVTRPFPGAFCYTEQGIQLMIWEAWSFDTLLDFSQYLPGEVIDTLYNRPVIRTKDGSIIVQSYEGAPLKPGDKLKDFKSP